MNDVGVLMGGDVNATAEQMKLVLDLESSIAEVIRLFVCPVNCLKNTLALFLVWRSIFA